jgi:hypothetical protein
MAYEDKLSTEDKAIVDRFNQEYSSDIVIAKRKDGSKTPTSMSKKVNVYVDGLLQTMSEDALNRLIDMGFYVVVTRKPGS